MEDKIKQLYEAISSSSDFTGIFTTPEEMVSTYNKDPNGFFDAINSSADFGGIFKDADDFATSVGLKKKDEPTSSPSIQEDIYGVSRMPADYLQQPSEEKPEPSSPVDAILEKNYEERAWPSPSKKFASWESGVRALSGEIERGEIQPDEFNARILSLASLVGLDYDAATGTASLPQREREIYEQQQQRAYQQFIQDKATKEKEGFMKDVLDNLNIGSQSVMTSPVRALAMSERIANGMIGLVDKKKRLSSTYWQDKAATEASVLDLWRSQNVRYDSDIASSIRSGDMGAAVGQTVLYIAENIPLLATLALGYGAGATNVALGYMGFDKGADEYLRSTSDPNMTELSRWVNFAVKGMSEIVFEGIGTVPILNSVRKGIAELGQRTMRDQLIQAYSPMLQKSFAMLNKGMSAAVREGGSEAATQLVDNLMDMSLGRDVKIGDGVFDSFVVGAAIGQGMVTPQMIAEYKGGQNALVKQIASSIPEDLEYEKKVELAQLLVESAQIKYDQGKKVAGMDAVNKVRLDEIQNRVAEIIGVPIKPAGEQKTTETGGVKDAESIGVKTEEAGAEAAPGVVEGEKGGVRLRNTTEDRLEAEPREIAVERTEEGDTMAMATPPEAPPTPEVKQQVRDEIARLNAISKGQKIVAIDDGMTGIVNKRVMDEFAAKPGMRALHIKGDNRSYIHLGRINSVEDARRAWLHEAGIHGGIERLFNTKEEYVANMLGVVKNLGGREAALDAIAELGGNRERYRSNTDAMVGEEYLAFLSRKVITDPNLNAEKVLAPQELSAWKKFVKAISDAVAKFMGTPLKLTDADIANLIIDSTRTAISEKGGKMDTVFARRGTTEQSEMLAEETIETPQGTKVIVAPFYDTKIKSIEEAATLRESEPYKRQQQQIKDVAEIMGIKIKDVSENIGGFVNEQGDKIIEVSNTITIDGTIEQAEAFAAVMGAMSQETQEATIAGVYVEPNSETHGIDEMSIPVGDINGAIEALATAGITDYTINETESTVQVLDFSKGEDAEFGNKITNFVNALSEKGITYGKQERRAVDSRYIDPDTRRDILGRISQDPVYQRQGGAGFRLLMERAALREEEFGIRKRGEARSEVVPADVVRNVAKSLGLTFPDVKVIVGKDNRATREAVVKALEEAGVPTAEAVARVYTTRWFKGFRGKAVSWKGKPVLIFINEELSTPNTIGHEMWHLILRNAFGDNAPLFKEFVGSIDAALRERGYGEVADSLKSFISSGAYETAQQYEEYLTQLGGYLTMGAIDVNTLSKGKTLIEQIRDILNRFARALVGRDIFLKDATADNILDFMTAISQRMAKGESVSEFLTGAEPKSKKDIEVRNQAVSIFSGALEKMDIKLGALTANGKVKVTNYEVATALSEYYTQTYGKIDIGDFSDTALRRAIDYAKAEVAYALNRWGTEAGQGWYTTDYAEALDILAEVYPEITSDKDLRNVATAVIAVASNSTDVFTNLTRVIYALESFKKSGRKELPLDISRGIAANSVAPAIGRYNKLLAHFNYDVDKLTNFLGQVDTVDNLKKVLFNEFGVGTKDALTKKLKVCTEPEWNEDEIVPMSIWIFGPKIGAFYGNLSGIHGIPTVDRWCIRTVYRYRGDMRSKLAKADLRKFASDHRMSKAPDLQVVELAKLHAKEFNAILTRKGKYEGYTKAQVKKAVVPYRPGSLIWARYEGVVNTIEDALGDANFVNDYTREGKPKGLNKAKYARDFRTFTRKVFEGVQSDLIAEGGPNLSISDIQAILWLFEKRLFGHMGVRQRQDATYSSGARRIVNYLRDGKLAMSDLLVGEWKVLDGIKDNTISEEGPMGEEVDVDIDLFEEGLEELAQRNTEESEINIKPSIASSPEIKRIKNHIRKMVLQAHGVNIMEKRAQAAYDIGVAEERLIRDVEEGKDKAAKKRAIETYRQLSKFISRAIKEADFATKLSRVQTRMIVNEARRVKDFDSLQDFFSTLDKIVDNTQYAAAMNSARMAQREIRKRVASSRYGKDTQMVLDFATMPLRVRDFEMEDLEEFNKVAELLLAGKVPADGVTALRSYKPPKLTEFIPKGIKDAINKIETVDDIVSLLDEWKKVEINNLGDYRKMTRAIDRLGVRIASIDFSEETLMAMEDALDGYEEWLEHEVILLAKAKEEIAEELEQEKLALIEESKTIAEDVDLESFYPEERIEVKKILDMREDELMRMTPKQIFLYRDIVHGLTEGFVNKEMYMFIQEMDVTLKRASWDVITAHLQSGYTKIRELGDKLAKANMRFIAKWIDPLRINEDFLTNVFNLSKMNVVDQKVLGIYDKNVQPIYENFIAPLMSAATAMDRDVEQAMNTYYAATKKVSKEEREMLGMLMAERDFRSGSIIIGGQEYTWDELPPEEKKDLFRWAAESRSKSMRHDVMDIMRVRKEMVLDEQGNIDIDASLDKMVKKNPAVAKLMAAARTIIDSQKGKARVAAEMRGDVFEDEGPDYFPRLIAESLNRQDPKMIEKGNIDSMTSPYRAVRKRAKSSFSRTHERHATEYDLDRVIGFYVYDVNRDYHLSRPITAISVALHRVAATSEVEDSGQVAAALRRSIVDRIKVQLAERSKIPVLSKLVNWKRTLALAQPERGLIELTANALRYGIENPEAMKPTNFKKMVDKRWREVAKTLASPISLKRLSRYDSELMVNDREGFLEHGAKLLYTIADTYAGRLVYANEFEKAFRGKAGKKFDIDKFIADEQYRIDNKEALAHADAMAMNMIESLYNSQSWATAPSQHRYIPGAMRKKLLSSRKGFTAQTLGYMQSFNFGETSEAMNSILAMVRPGVSSDAKARAGRRILNLMVSNYVYMTMRGAIFVMLNSAIDDEDDFFESLGNYFSLKNQAKMFVGSVATLGMGRHGALVRLATSVFLGFADYANEDSESLRLIVDTANQSINARPINPNKRMKFVDFVDQVGMIWGDIAADLARMGMSAVDLAKQVSEEGIDSLTLDQKETWVALSTMNQMLALAVPNFVSPVAERVIRAFRYSVGPDYQVDPDKKARTVNGTDIKDLYKLAPVSGMTSKAITVYSTGERMENKREISDGELKKYQSLAREKFDAYVREYTVNNRGMIAAEAQAGTVSDARSDEVQKDINELWKKAKKQAQIELYEYPSAKRHSEYSRVVKYGALPEPISEAERTVDGEKVNMMMDPALAKEVNKTFIRLYLEWFSSHYATEAAVKTDKRDIQENGKSKFDNEVNEAVKKLRAEAKSQHLK